MSERSVGEFPTTGTSRSGPVGWLSLATPFLGVRPISMRIPAIQVDAEIERRPVVDGVMADPTGPYVIAWYGATSKLGIGGNVVLAGHVDYAGVGPAVFARIAE
ncbi:MAG: class F sortase, partial [Fimbriimonadaceae bacterium]